MPAATHSFTGGVVYWANQAKKDLEKATPRHEGHREDRRVGAPEQANQLQDLVTVNKINTLVIFPFESAALTQAGGPGQGQGRVRDGGRPGPHRHQRAGRLRRRRQHRPSARSRPNTWPRALDGKGNIVALRGIPTTLDNERMDAFNAVMKATPGHQAAGRQARQLEPRRRLQGDAGLPDALQADRRRVGRRRRHGGGRAPRPSSRPSARTSRSCWAAPAPRATIKTLMDGDNGR